MKDIKKVEETNEIIKEANKPLENMLIMAK